MNEQAQTHETVSLRQYVPEGWEYADGLSILAPWSHWATLTWRPRSVLTTTGAVHRRAAQEGDASAERSTGAFLVRRFDDERSGRTWVGLQPDPISLPAVRRAVARWCWRIKPRHIFWATEEGGRFGRHHVHCLLTLTEGSIRRDPWALAFRWFGRTELEDYDPQQGAAHYVGKYVTKKASDHDYLTRQRGYPR